MCQQTSEVKLILAAINGSTTVAPAQTKATTKIFRPPKLRRLLACGKTGMAYSTVKRANTAIAVYSLMLRKYPK